MTVHENENVAGRTAPRWENELLSHHTWRKRRKDGAEANILYIFMMKSEGGPI